ncbi:MAG TPA: class I SAM-dependent methyltransferase [Puia sp.]|nr:class I SAM-dependent methyltransferase [Puia sp.]
MSSNMINERAIVDAFNKQSVIFDDLYSSNGIIRYKRERVRTHVQKYLPANSMILELNAGTGEDAIYFARQGHRVHATDISPGMLDVLNQKVTRHGFSGQISSEICSYSFLGNLDNKGPYDLIFSNFAGLNCTNELDSILAGLGALVKPGGMVTLVLLPSFCLWETLLLFKGHFSTAFRRFNSSKAAAAHIEGQYFKCWYYKPSYVIDHMKYSFNLLDVEGLCTIVPPSYIEKFDEKYPVIFKWLKRKEDQLKNKRPWRSIGDYYIISFRRKEGSIS